MKKCAKQVKIFLYNYSTIKIRKRPYLPLFTPIYHAFFYIRDDAVNDRNNKKEKENKSQGKKYRLFDFEKSRNRIMQNNEKNA